MGDISLSELEARLVSTSVAPVDPVKRVDALNELAWELRGTEGNRANDLATEARELALEHGYTLGQARAVRTLAQTFRDVESLRMVFPLAEEARRLFDEANDGPGRAASRDFLASLYEYIGDLAGGLELALDALSIAREVGDPIRQGYALSSVGGLLAASGEVDVAVERLKEASSLFEGANDAAGVGVIQSRLSRVLKAAGRNDEALTFARLCCDAPEGANTSYLRWSGLTVMAEVEAERGQLVEAERLYRAALDSFEAGETSRSVMGAETQIALGRILTERGAFDEAEAELESVLRLIEHESFAIVNEAAAHEALAVLCECRGQLSATIEHLRKAQELRERIAQREAGNKLAQVEGRAAVEAATKDAEIHKLRFVELHGMQSKLVEAEKMALLGRLAAGTAHELNTPLGVLRSNTELTASATARLLSLVRAEDAIGVQATRLAAVLESCSATNHEAMERIATLAQSFGRFTQLDRAELCFFDVREGVDSALVLLEPTISENIEIERRFEEVPAIEGWPRELNLAFLTVLQNAVQAIEGAGVVSAETSTTPDSVLVRIRDTGSGMSEDQAANLFDVAWSEGETRVRMRLGLSAAFSTMQKHGGAIDVESVLGQGTVITFRFPLPQQTP